MSNSIQLPDIANNEEFPAEPPITPIGGGVFTPIQNWAYPYKGHPMEVTVEVLAAIKGVIPMGLRFIELSIKHLNLLALLDIKNTYYEKLEYGGKILAARQPHNPKRYGRAVREIYRVLTIQVDKINSDPNAPLLIRKLWCIFYNIRTIICVLCEWDNAYRYRVQDVLTELDMVNLCKHPIKELRRVLSIMVERENRGHKKKLWQRAKLALTFFLLVNPKIKNKIVEILSEINKEEIQFEDDDWYCICMRGFDGKNDYNFGGLTTEQILKWKNFEKRN